MNGQEEEIVPKISPIHCIHPKWLEHSIFKSLSKLKLETIDCVYLHDPLENILKITKGDLMETRSKLKEAF
jgi:aryl-alcohol dehydrogenase-like predicted oxidoreductase